MRRQSRTLVGSGKFRGTLTRFFWLLAATPALGACGNSAQSENVDGSLQGELHIYRINREDGRSEREFYLAPDEHSPATTRLVFAQDPELEPWTRLKIWGTRTAEGVKVTRFETEPEDDLASSSQALTMVTPRPRTVGFVMMDVGSGVSLTAEAAQTAVFGNRNATQAGLNQYYREVSYGAVTLSGEILGPVMNSTLGSCQQSAITQIENGWATQFNKTFDHWMTYIGSKYSNCGWSGIGGEGTAARPAKGSWYNGSTGCTVLAQEVGHNFGMMHSGSLTCSGTPLADDPLTCMGSEYGNRNTVMGSGCAHLNAYEKWYEGFFGGCNGVRVAGGGTFTLYPTELPCDGVQALQIPMPKSRPFKNTSGTTTQINLTHYYLELRTTTSIDGNVKAPNVMVTVAGDVPASNKTSQFTWNLDMDPSTTTADGMLAGQTYQDPAGGLTITVKDVAATHATIDVTMTATGTTTCMDGSTFTPPGPSTCTGLIVGGSGGMSGTGGATGMGGAAGASGGGGRGGGGGTAGRTNTSGGTSSGGASSGGTPSSGGAPPASGGAPVTSGGALSGGAPGAGMTGVAGGTVIDPPSDAGCGCRTAPARPSNAGAAAFALLGLSLARKRRSKSRGS